MSTKSRNLVCSVLFLAMLLVNATCLRAGAANTVSITKQPTGAVVYAGDTAKLSVTASSSSKLAYQWYKGTSSSTPAGIKVTGATSSTYSLTTATAGTYYFYCRVSTSGSGTYVYSDVVTVVVKALPAITAQPAGVSVYNGETVNLSVKATGSGILTYQWYSNTVKSTSDAVIISGAVDSSYAPPTATAGTTYYYCVVTNTDSSVTATAARSVTSSIVKVVVNTLSSTAPVITSQPSPVTVYAGSSAQFSVSAAASGTLSYQWYSSTSLSAADGTAIQSAAASSYAIPTNTVGTVYYYCVVTNTVPSDSDTSTYKTTSNIVSCTVKPLTAITQQPVGTTVKMGDSVTLSVAATGSGTLSYQWYVSKTNSTTGASKISGASSPSYTVPTTGTGIVYLYCVVTNTDNAVTQSSKTCVATSDIVQVTVAADAITAPAITTQPASATVYTGTSKILSVAATGTGELTYQWYSNTSDSTENGTPISGADGETYTAANAAAGTTYYYCVVKNTAYVASGYDSQTAASAVAAMTVLPTPGITSQPEDASLCRGSTVTLSVSATGSGTLTYQWYKSSVNVASGTLIKGAIAPLYTVQASSLGKAYYYCVVTSSDSRITETVKTASITSKLAKITVVSADAALPVITKQPSNVSVIAGDSATLSVTATGSGTLSYQWYSSKKQSAASAAPVSGATGSTFSPPTDTAGKLYYYCLVTNTDTAKPGSQSTSLKSNVVFVSVKSKEPAVTKQPSPANIYVGDKYYLSVTATGSGNLSYQWYCSMGDDNTSGTAITGATSSRYLVPSSSVDTLYYYCVIVNTVASASGTVTGTAITSPARVDTIAAPAITAQPADATINSGESLTLTVAASGSGTTSYQWFSTNSKSSTGAAIKGATGASYRLTTAAASATKTVYYYCAVTVFNKSMTVSPKVTLRSLPAAVTIKAVNASAPSITKNPVSQTLKVGGSATLTVTAAGSGTLTYQWYSNTKNSTAGATLISGATSPSFTVPTSAAGSTYYFCVVTNTDDAMSGSKTGTAKSAVVRIVVKSA